MGNPLQEMSNEELWALFPIVLCKHQPGWAQQYQNEALALKHAVGAEHIARISHIGSTAVPGLLAKPTVDILLEVWEEATNQYLIDRMVSANYIFSPQPQKPPPHMMFMKGYTQAGFAEEVFHVHVRYPGDWDELYFRDYLAEHPGVLAEYGELKASLKELYEHDRDGYTQAKAQFIKMHTKAAREQYRGRYEHK